MINETFTTVKTSQTLLGSTFVLGSSTMGRLGFSIFTPEPNALQTIAPAYLYNEYADDADLQAFVTAYNNFAQSYLDWFNTTSLPIYTQPNISGTLLDWAGVGIYNYPRPLIVTQATSGRSQGAYGMSAYGTQAYGTRGQKITAGTSIPVSDDVYKRALTWHAYLGDGKQMSVQWFKRRLARFLYGIGGTDISINNLQNISINFKSATRSIGYYGSSFYGQTAYGIRKKLTKTFPVINILLPSTPLSGTLQSLINNGFLAIPFQVKISVTVP